MARRFRLDYSSLGEVQRTPQGGLQVDAALTRSGVFTYTTQDGKPIREWRPMAEVTRADTLATLKGAPLTLDHPPEKVKPENFRQFSLGHVGDDVRQDADKTVATVRIQDQQAIRAVESGRRDISLGYHCDVDETPGIVPAGEPDAGLPYDRIQRGIQYNHCALVQRGRAGDDVRLRLDSEGDSITEPPAKQLSFPTRERIETMEKIEIIGGVEYPIGSDAHRAARERSDSASKELLAAVHKLRSQRDEAVKAADAAKGRADAASAKLVGLENGIKKTFSQERIDAMVRTRASLLEMGRARLGKEFKADGLSNREIRVAILRKAFPELTELRQDSADKPLSSDYLKGLWSALKTRKPETRNDAADDLRRAVTPTHASKSSTSKKVRLDFYDEQEQRAHRPLAMSKTTRGNNPMLQSAQLETMR